MDSRLRVKTAKLDVETVTKCAQHIHFIKRQRRRINQKQSALNQYRVECAHEIGIHIGDIGSRPMHICLFCEHPLDNEPIYIIEAPREIMLKEEVYEFVEQMRTLYISMLNKEPELTLEETVKKLKEKYEI